MTIRDTLKIKAKGVDITYHGDGQCNHYYLLMVFGMKSDEAYKVAYRK